MILAVQGSTQGWVPAHVLMLGSLFCYVAVIVGASQLLGMHKGIWGVLGDGATALAMVGLLLLVSQIMIDITVGVLASTPGEMEHLFGKIRAIPGMEYAFYRIGPLLFFLGLFLLILLLARFRVFAFWSAGVAGAGGILFGVVGMGLNVLPSALIVPLSLGGIWIGSSAQRLEVTDASVMEVGAAAIINGVAPTSSADTPVAPFGCLAINPSGRPIPPASFFLS